MPIHNTELSTGDLNFLWSYAFADMLASSGVQHAVISPGSRSTPLTLAFTHHPGINCHSIVDERSAGFFALGIGKASGKPAVLICTSGTAGTNYFPAVTEAYYSQTPLIIATADRPPHLQHTGSNQTINQRNLYGDKVIHYSGFTLPHRDGMKSVQRDAAEIYRFASHPPCGPVHCNFPFKKPLEPSEPSDIKVLLELYKEQSLNRTDISGDVYDPPHSDLEYLWSTFKKYKEGMIFAGPAAYQPDLIKVIHSLSALTGYPVVADGLSQLRQNSENNTDILHFSSDYFRSDTIRELAKPECIIRFGGLPTSNCLNQFLSQCQDIPHILIHNLPAPVDVIHTVSRVISIDYSELNQSLIEFSSTLTSGNQLSETFNKFEDKTITILDRLFNSSKVISEPLLYRNIHALLPESADIFLSNSLPVRDYDTFALPSDRDHRIYFNRGASGIDGILSSALGIASSGQRPLLLITGELALYHDLNALTYLRNADVPFVVLLIDNDGGGIFEMLPVAQYGTVYEQFIRTPLNLNFEGIISGFNIEYARPATVSEYEDTLRQAFLESKVQIIHVRTNAKESMNIRRSAWNEITAAAEDLI